MVVEVVEVKVVTIQHPLSHHQKRRHQRPCPPVSSNITHTKCAAMKQFSLKKSVVSAIAGSVLGLFFMLCFIFSCVFGCYSCNRKPRDVHPEPAPTRSKLVQCKELDHLGFSLKLITCRDMAGQQKSERVRLWLEM